MEDTASESKKRQYFCGNPFGGLFRLFFFTFGSCIFNVYQDFLTISTPSSSQLQELQFCFYNFLIRGRSNADFYGKESGKKAIYLLKTFRDLKGYGNESKKIGDFFAQNPLEGF